MRRMGSTEGTAEKNGARGRKRAAPVVEEAPRAPRSRIVGLRTLPLERIDRFGFGNPKHMTEEVRRALHTSLDEFGTILPLIARPHPSGDPGRVELIDGHHRLDDFAARGDTVAEVLVVDVPDDMRARALLLAIKGIQADFDPEALPAYIEGLIAETDATQEWLASVSAVDLSFLETEPGAGEAGAGEGGEVRATDGHVNLGGIAERFLVPPFTVLDARAGWWRERKQAWLSLGIKSEVGRGGAAPGSTGAAPTSGAWLNRRGDGSTAPADPKWKKGAPAAKGLAVKDVAAYVPKFYHLKTALERKLGREVSKGEFEREHFPAILAARGNDPRYSGGLSSTGTSVFDPVLCELSFRWFSPPGGSVLDPFAGGSVRGVVAAALGREYVGIELRPEQVEANREQWATIGPRLRAAPPPAGGAPARPPVGPDPVWVEGDSQHSATLTPGEYDLLFSCPPYADLEVYSDDPRDLSAMSYPDFLATYRTIIARSVAMLRPDRFAVWVVGDVRDPRGMYRGLVADTIAAFRAAGAELYNEAVLVTPVGSLPVRVGRQFAAARKLGKTHQNVLVFVKGDPKKATAACGAVEVGEVPYGEEITEEEVVEDEPERTNPETAEEAPPPRA